MEFREYCERWLSDLELSGSVEPSTIRDYRHNLDSWGDLRGKDVSEVTRRDVEASMRAMLASGRVPGTVKKRAIVLRRVFEDALEYGDVDSNPISRVKMPKLPKTSKNFLPVEERERLKARISSQNGRVYVAAALALYCGLREGEVCALRASDVNLEASLGWVRRSIGGSMGGYYVKEPKNGHLRDFPIPEPLSVVLGRWVDSNSAHGDSYLLTGTSDFMRPDILGRLWSSLCEVEGFRGVIGRKPTFHDLRHTYATVAIASGVDVKTVSSVLGHSSAAMTLDIYAVADPVAKRMSAEVMGRAI